MPVVFLTNEDNVVQYSRQTLTEDQKAQARENIGAELSVLDMLIGFGIAPVFLDADGTVLTDGDDVVFTNN